MLKGKKPIGTVGYMGGVFAVPEAFLFSYSQMIQYNNDYLVLDNETVYYTRATISYHSAARNSLVDSMKGDWLLMLDTDHQFEPDLAARMLRVFYEFELEVISAIYLHKSPPHSPVVYQWGEQGLFAVGNWDRKNAIIPVGSVGAGALLVRRRVFDRIIDELKEQPFDISPPYGEDHSFFQRVKKLGLKAYCATHIESNHLRMTPLSLANYDMESVMLGEKIFYS